MPVKILTFRIFTKSGAATLRNRRRKSACSSCAAVLAVCGLTAVAQAAEDTAPADLFDMAIALL